MTSRSSSGSRSWATRARCALTRLADQSVFQVETVSCSSRSQAHALLEVAAHQSRCHGYRKLRILGLDRAFAEDTSLFNLDTFGYQPGVIVLNPDLATHELEWPFEVSNWLKFPR